MGRGKVKNNVFYFHCCQVAESSAKKLKGGRRKMKWHEKVMANFDIISQKVAEENCQQQFFLLKMFTLKAQQDALA
jgi:hypothetical protein